MRSSAAKIQMTSFDDLFQPSGVEQQTTTEQIQDMSLKKLISFHNHPFQVRDDEEMQKTAELRNMAFWFPPLLVLLAGTCMS